MFFILSSFLAILCPLDFDIKSDEAYDAAIKDLVDPLLPTRGHAIIQLSNLLDKRNPKATRNVELLCDVFMENLQHDDSYIYLASIRALTSVSQSQHQIVVPRLAKEFAGFSNEANNGDVFLESFLNVNVANLYFLYIFCFRFS